MNTSLSTLRAVALLAVSVFAADSAIAQTPSTTTTPTETSGIQQQPPAPGPISHSWHMKKVNGTANIVVNPDGSYIFSGQVNDKKPNRDFDITLALKSNLGAVVLFEYAGNDANGAQWSKQGQSDALKEDFSTFAGKHETAWAYTLPLSSEGRAQLYEERERKKAELRKEEEEAKKRHEEKVAAEKKRELEKEQQQEVSEQQNSNGSSVGSVLGTIGTIAGTILAFL
jgi:hypothetical protein